MNVDFADEEMIAYRESLIEKKKSLRTATTSIDFE